MIDSGVTQQLDPAQDSVSLVQCSLCSNRASLLYSKHPGFLEGGAEYDIYSCAICDSSFAVPLELDPAIYELIYQRSRDIPGYDRYAKYAEEARSSENPRAFLSNAEDMYYSVFAMLDELKLSPESRIVEIGSGYGYLTYALAHEGYSARGIEISSRAVSEARARYGDLYECSDALAFAETHKESVDVVVLTEVIEHIPDPLSLIRAIRQLLAPGGYLLLTTPNRTFFPPESVWDTDLPPVHLWWFSETSMRFIADRAGFVVQFFDFADLNRRKFVGFRPRRRSTPLPSTLRLNGSIYDGTALYRSLRDAGLLELARVPFKWLSDVARFCSGQFGGVDHRYLSRRQTLSVAFRKPNEAAACVGSMS